MNVKIEETDDKYLVALEGELDTVASVAVEQQLKGLFNSKGKEIVIECKKLSYIASSGLRILFRILKGAKASGSRVLLKHVNDEIMNVFRLTGFVSIFDFE